MTIPTFRSRAEFGEWARMKYWDNAIPDSESRYSVFYRLGYYDWAEGQVYFVSEPTRAEGYQRGVEDAEADWEAYSENS